MDGRGAGLPAHRRRRHLHRHPAVRHRGRSGGDVPHCLGVRQDFVRSLRLGPDAADVHRDGAQRHLLRLAEIWHRPDHRAALSGCQERPRGEEGRLHRRADERSHLGTIHVHRHGAVCLLPCSRRTPLARGHQGRRGVPLLHRPRVARRHPRTHYRSPGGSGHLVAGLRPELPVGHCRARLLQAFPQGRHRPSATALRPLDGGGCRRGSHRRGVPLHHVGRRGRAGSPVLALRHLLGWHRGHLHPRTLLAACQQAGPLHRHRSRRALYGLRRADLDEGGYRRRRREADADRPGQLELRTP